MSDPIVHAEVDTSNFERALVRYQVETQMAWTDVIRMQARLLVERLIEWTPPFGKGKDAQSKGQKRVEADIRRVFTDFGKFQFRELSIQKAWETEDKETLSRIFKNSPHLSQYTLLDAPVAQIHEGIRVAGKVPKKNQPRFVVMDGRRSGENKIAAYAREVGRRVGKAKAGWIMAAQLLAAKFPAWITKSGGETLGGVRDNSTNSSDPSITMSNIVPYASDIFSESKQQELLDTRVRDMEANTEHYLEAKARKTGL